MYPHIDPAKMKIKMKIVREKKDWLLASIGW
jgi:hypothetical protein